MLSGRRAVDLGAGTGRLTLEMLPYVESATAVDASAEMLERLALKAGPQASSKLEIVVADYASTGLPSGAYDLIVSGWAVCYCASSTFPGWEERLDLVITEMKRIARPGADIILFENYGTAVEQPLPPDYLLPYFQRLESVYGFQLRIIQTDYRFNRFR